MSTEKMTNIAGTDRSCAEAVTKEVLLVSLRYSAVCQACRGRCSDGTDENSCLLEWRQGRSARVLKERPARGTGRASCWSDWKSVVLE
jgi:hypothetical protein